MDLEAGGNSSTWSNIPFYWILWLVTKISVALQTVHFTTEISEFFEIA